MQETTALQPYSENNIVVATPRDQMKAAADMAKLLNDLVKQAGLSKKFGGQKEHLEFEAWQTIARWFNCTPVTEWTRPIKDGEEIIGWESRVNVVDSSGRIIASAENMCMRDEPNWKTKPNYALRSMAQTRTAGKALRSVFAFVAVLAGYSPTPAEEMSESFESKPESVFRRKSPAETPKTQEATPAAGPGNATQAQYKKLYALGFETWPDRDKKDVSSMVRSIGAWYRKGDVLTKKEASELIENWGGAVDHYNYEMADADYTREPEDVLI